MKGMAAVLPLHGSKRPLSADAEAVLAAVSDLAHSPGSLVPCDSQLLRALWPSTVPPATSVENGLRELLQAGLLRQVVVGTAAHVTAATPGPAATQAGSTSTQVGPELAPTPTAPAVPPRDDRRLADTPDLLDERLFELGVAVDAETERLLLYRLLLVLEAVAGVMMLRELALLLL